MACEVQQAGYSNLVCVCVSAHDDVSSSKGCCALKATQQKMISSPPARDLALSDDGDSRDRLWREDKPRLQQLSEQRKLQLSADHLHKMQLHMQHPTDAAALLAWCAAGRKKI